jgi:hypothetical protein
MSSLARTPHTKEGKGTSRSVGFRESRGWEGRQAGTNATLHLPDESLGGGGESEEAKRNRQLFSFAPRSFVDIRWRYPAQVGAQISSFVFAGLADCGSLNSLLARMRIQRASFAIDETFSARSTFFYTYALPPGGSLAPSFALLIDFLLQLIVATMPSFIVALLKMAPMLRLHVSFFLFYSFISHAFKLQLTPLPSVDR